MVLGSHVARPAADERPLDRFVQIGSVTKVVTGTAFARMTSAGLVAADDPVERWLPAPAGSGVTLAQLAEHTSGLPRLPPGRVSRADPYARFDAATLRGVAQRLDRLLVRPPGTDVEYSNLGYALLGAALAQAANASYQELAREHVLDPLGLDEITADPPAARRLHAAGLLGRPSRPWDMSGAILPAGGLWATPRALAALVRGLLIDQRLGAPASCWQVSGAVIWHNGATRGASAFVGADPARGAWVAAHQLGGSPDQTDRIGTAALAAAAEPDETSEPALPSG